MPSLEITIRIATLKDIKLIHSFIVQKAEFDGFIQPLQLSIKQLQKTLFTDSPLAEVLLAEVNQTAVGFALIYPTFSSFLAQPTLWIDDLFVLPDMRHQGVGTALLEEIATIAKIRNYGRIEWTVATRNTSAINFYKKQGAEILDNLRLCRVVV